MYRVIDPRDREDLRAKIRKLSAPLQEITMSISDQIHEEGFAEGRIATLRDLLAYKFRALDAASEARLRAASPDAIDRYLRRVLTADSLAAVFRRLS